MSKIGSIVNPLTGRRIAVGGRTHRKIQSLIRDIDRQTQTQTQTGGGPDVPGPSFYQKLLEDAKKSPDAKGLPVPVSSDTVILPKSKYNLISSVMPPNPEQHSWYHHHAPFSQTFGDYICLKKSTLHEIGVFLKDGLGLS